MSIIQIYFLFDDSQLGVFCGAAEDFSFVAEHTCGSYSLWIHVLRLKQNYCTGE